MKKNILVAGNWKMNKSVDEGQKLLNDLLENFPNLHSNIKVAVAPTFLHLGALKAIFQKNTNLGIAAQNCANKNNGAFTGEVSAQMLADFGVQYCIVGHSERRQFYGETDEIIAQKLKLLLENNIIPIFCCGEMLEQRNENQHFEVNKSQITKGLSSLSKDEIAKTIIAYEPVWAIGTGLTASAEQAQEMHAFIREIIAEMFGKDIAEQILILYGGSCKSSNALELFSQKDVNGGLIGGAALDASEFLKIISIANSL